MKAEDRTLAAAAVALAALTLVAYAPAVGHGFVSLDDPQYAADNPQVRAGLTLRGILWAFTTLHAGLWIPTTWLSLMADSQLLGTAPWGYHATNVVLHVASTVLLFLWLARATGAVAASLLAAGLFALHPLHVESVAWITERKDVLSTFFLLVTLWAHRR